MLLPISHVACVSFAMPRRTPSAIVCPCIAGAALPLWWKIPSPKAPRGFHIPSKACHCKFRQKTWICKKIKVWRKNASNTSDTNQDNGNTGRSVGSLLPSDGGGGQQWGEGGIGWPKAHSRAASTATATGYTSGSGITANPGATEPGEAGWR